jgi:hypothetical protein
MKKDIVDSKLLSYNRRALHNASKILYVSIEHISIYLPCESEYLYVAHICVVRFSFIHHFSICGLPKITPQGKMHPLLPRQAATTKNKYDENYNYK